MPTSTAPQFFPHSNRAHDPDYADPDYAIARLTPAAQSKLAIVKSHIGIGYDQPYHPSALLDMRPAGIDEIWSLGWRQRLLKYDLELNLKAVINLYGTPQPRNNYCFAWDMSADFEAGLIFVSCWSYNCVRVYDLNTFANAEYVGGTNGTGGHLYDIGLANGTASWFRADKGSAVRNGEGGALYNVSSAAPDGTGKLLVASYSGYGSASAVTNVGFISQWHYSRSGASFDRIIAAYDGVYEHGDTIVKTSFRNPYGKLRVRPGTHRFVIATDVAINGQYGYHEIDLDQLAAGGLERRLAPTHNTLTYHWRPYGLDFDTNGNLILTNRLSEYAVLEESPERQLLNVAAVQDASSTTSQTYYRFQWPAAVLKLENVNGQDWLIIADYTNHKISIMPWPDGHVDGTPFIEVDIDFQTHAGQTTVFPSNRTVVHHLPAQAQVDIDQHRAKLPLGELSPDAEIVLLLD